MFPSINRYKRSTRRAGLWRHTSRRWRIVLCAAAIVLPATPTQAQPPNRALSLSPHITELLFAAGAGDRIVATVTSSDYPDAARALPRVGDGLNINIEKALALQPDIVLAWAPSGAAHTLARFLVPLKIPLQYSNPRKLEDVPAEIRRFGVLFETQAQAKGVASALSARLNALRQRYASRSPLKVFIEIGTSPLYTIGSDPLLNDALETCGASNVYGSASIPAPQVSAESVLVHNPDVVITAAANAAGLDEARQRWSALHLPAAQQGHVYGIDPDELFRPGPRLLDAAEQLCQYLDLAR